MRKKQFVFFRMYIEKAEVYYRTQIAYGFSINKCLEPPHDQHYNESNFYNKEGYKLVADLVYEKMNELGYFSEIKEISEQLNISLQNAKSAVDSAADGRKVLLTQSFDKSFIDKIKNALEAKECICEITEN